MIKCNVTVCGVIGRDASMHTNKEGNAFAPFPLRIVIPGKDGQHETVEVSVSKNGSQEETSGYRNGSRVEVTGVMYLKRRGEKLYFNLSAEHIKPATGNDDSIKGQMSFRGGRPEHRGTERQKRQTLYDVLGFQHGESKRWFRVSMGTFFLLRPTT